MPASHEKYKFKVDDTVYESTAAIVTGRRIKELAGVNSTYQLFLEEPGDAHPDRQIRDDEQIDLSKPGIEKLYTMPPATFGL